MIKEVEISELKLLSNVIRETYGFNFEEYAFNFFRRSVLRASAELHVSSMEELIAKIKIDKQFFDRFCSSLVVKTTEFFRDPSFWTVFKNLLKEYASNKDELRIWTAGCASGEEVLSLAVLLSEENLIHKTRIIATETNCINLNHLKLLQYDSKMFETALSNYNKIGFSEDFTKYISLNNGSLDFNRSLIENVTTSCGELFKFNFEHRFDVILCRNVMIYFNRKLQDKVLDNFSESLVSGGILAIGVNETLSGFNSSKHFFTLSEPECIFSRY